MREGLSGDVDRQSYSPRQQVTLVPKKVRSFEHELRFVHLSRSPRFSSTAEIDTVKVNLLTRLFRARRST